MKLRARKGNHIRTLKSLTVSDFDDINNKRKVGFLMRNTKVSKDGVMNKDNALISLGVFIDRHAALIFAVCLAFLFVFIGVSGTAYAAGIDPGGGGGDGAADAMWGAIQELIGTWVTRLGGVVMFVGGVMFGLGWKNDDAEQKSRGMQTIIAGAIVAAIAGMVATFFNG